MALSVQPLTARLAKPLRLAPMRWSASEGQIVGSVDGGEVADVGGRRAVVEVGVGRIHEMKAGVLALTLVFQAEPLSRFFDQV